MVLLARTGVPDLDALIDAANREATEAARIVALNDAESAEARIRSDDLVGQQMAASRRWSAAKDLLTKARKRGDAAKIAAARERCDDLVGECFICSAGFKAVGPARYASDRESRSHEDVQILQWACRVHRQRRRRLGSIRGT